LGSFLRNPKAKQNQQIPRNTKDRHKATSNIIFNLAQMGISIGDAFFIDIDTYLELLDLFNKQNSDEGKVEASQSDIDKFLL
jgi:hypothetical protein